MQFNSFVLQYQNYVGKWSKCVVPLTLVRGAKYYGYDILLPNKDLQQWLDETCNGAYRLNGYGGLLAIYFEDPSMPVMFKLTWL
jgi:hypothetical protein